MRGLSLVILLAWGFALPLESLPAAHGQGRRAVRPGAAMRRDNAPRRVDEDRARRAGIRKLVGKHLVLYTDLPSSPQVDQLPALFDQAVPQWAEYFGVRESRTRDWQVQGFLIADRQKFEALGLMPAGNREFTHGISLGREFWLFDQPTAYYRRHLLLHEGTHAFMMSLLGGCGPGWYMEGTAELFATHRFDDRYKRLTLRTMPANRDEVPMLGRIRLIEDARERGRLLTLPAVLQVDGREQLGNEAYAWCWAAAKFLDTHPRYRDRFRELQSHVTRSDFNDRFRRKFPGDWDDLQADWMAFVGALDHGYDFERMAIAFERGQPLGPAPRTVTIAADRGWQSSGVWLEAGRTYRITAAGRYQIAHDGEAWPCEPGGVTIEYYEGRPLGELLGAIDARVENRTLANPLALGREAVLAPVTAGTLYLRVNDSPGKLSDNRGTLTVTIAESRDEIYQLP